MTFEFRYRQPPCDVSFLSVVDGETLYNSSDHHASEIKEATIRQIGWHPIRLSPEWFLSTQGFTTVSKVIQTLQCTIQYVDHVCGKLRHENAKLSSAMKQCSSERAASFEEVVELREHVSLLKKRLRLTKEDAHRRPGAVTTQAQGPGEQTVGTVRGLACTICGNAYPNVHALASHFRKRHRRPEDFAEMAAVSAAAQHQVAAQQYQDDEQVRQLARSPAKMYLDPDSHQTRGLTALQTEVSELRLTIAKLLQAQTEAAQGSLPANAMGVPASTPVHTDGGAPATVSSGGLPGFAFMQGASALSASSTRIQSITPAQEAAAAAAALVRQKDDEILSLRKEMKAMQKAMEELRAPTQTYATLPGSALVLHARNSQDDMEKKRNSHDNGSSASKQDCHNTTNKPEASSILPTHDSSKKDSSLLHSLRQEVEKDEILQPPLHPGSRHGATPAVTAAAANGKSPARPDGSDRFSLPSSADVWSDSVLYSALGKPGEGVPLSAPNSVVPPRGEAADPLRKTSEVVGTARPVGPPVAAMAQHGSQRSTSERTASPEVVAPDTATAAPSPAAVAQQRSRADSSSLNLAPQTVSSFPAARRSLPSPMEAELHRTDSTPMPPALSGNSHTTPPTERKGSRDARPKQLPSETRQPNLSLTPMRMETTTTNTEHSGLRRDYGVDADTNAPLFDESSRTSPRTGSLPSVTVEEERREQALPSPPRDALRATISGSGVLPPRATYEVQPEPSVEQGDDDDVDGKPQQSQHYGVGGGVLPVLATNEGQANVGARHSASNSLSFYSKGANVWADQTTEEPPNSNRQDNNDVVLEESLESVDLEAQPKRGNASSLGKGFLLSHTTVSPKTLKQQTPEPQHTGDTPTYYHGSGAQGGDTIDVYAERYDDDPSSTRNTASVPRQDGQDNTGKAFPAIESFKKFLKSYDLSDDGDHSSPVTNANRGRRSSIDDAVKDHTKPTSATDAHRKGPDTSSSYEYYYSSEPEKRNAQHSAKDREQRIKEGGTGDAHSGDYDYYSSYYSYYDSGSDNNSEGVVSSNLAALPSQRPPGNHDVFLSNAPLQELHGVESSTVRQEPGKKKGVFSKLFKKKKEHL